MSGAVVTNPANGAPPRDEHELRKEAVAWCTLLCSGAATEADRREWQQWHDRHPDHQRAWQRFEAMTALMQNVPPRIGMPALQSPARGRRQALRGLALLTSGASLGYVVYRSGDADPPWQATLADYRTGVGERRSVELADGSLLVLNTDSAVDVRFSVAQHRLVFRAGEIWLETAHRRDAAAPHDPRPFVVETAHGRVQALGTRFTVRRQAESTTVVVVQDAVAVAAAQAPQRPVLLRAGQRVRFSAAGVASPQADDGTAAAWRDGSIVVGDWALGRLVAELDRYRPGWLVCDAAVAQLRVSGAFPVDNTDKALAVLARSLPVRLRWRSRYWVTVVPA